MRAGVSALLINSFEFDVGRTLELESVIGEVGRGGEGRGGTRDIVVYVNMGSSVMLVSRNAALFCWQRARNEALLISAVRALSIAMGDRIVPCEIVS